MLIGQGFQGCEFDDETVFNEEISKIVPERSSVFVGNIQRVLLEDEKILLP